ncbi:MAG: hypothetical protein WBD13_00645 [Burkholderiaceae bacterium]
MKLNIGILLSNTDRSAFASRFDNDGLKTAALLARQRPDWGYTIYQAVDGELPARTDAHDGYVITGSPASVNVDEPWMSGLFEFIRRCAAAEAPVVGLCFGHQAIAHALGGQVEQASDWGLGIAVTEFDAPAHWMQPRREQLSLHAAHEDQVTGLPPGARRLGGNAWCHYGAFAIGNHVFTTQYHPEFNHDFMHALVRDKIGPHLDVATVSDALAQLAQTDPQADADIFAHWMVQFFEQA